MNKLKVLDLFSGIGGFSLGLERTGGFETVAFCEIEKYPQKVLKKHWPDVPIYEDARGLTYDRLKSDGITVDVITGGFPCQDISLAGNQAGISEGTRSGLWSECARLLGEIRPDYAIFENVTALLSGESGRWFQRVLWDISQIGYNAEWHCIPASAIGAHHRRDRVWIVAYPNELANGQQFINEKERNNNKGKNNEMAHADRKHGKNGWRLLTSIYRQKKNQGYIRSGGNGGRRECREWHTEPAVGRVVNGIPNRAHRLKGLGNAVVPQIPEIIGHAILEMANAN